MKFDVVWDRDAESDLAEMWLAARDRQRLSEASERIEERLRRSPETAGESREAGVRLVFEDPLWVEFEIDEPNRKVHILTVWRRGR